MSEAKKSQEQADDRVEDLDVEKSEAEEVKGGLTTRKAGGKQEDYLKVTMSDVLISS
jgi:type VI protein secretion system component Hcp